MRSAKGCAAIGTAGKHHVSTVVSTERFDACQHINVVVSGRPGTVHSHERLSTKSYSIYAALNEVATQVDLSGLVESWGDVPVLGIGRTDAIKRAPSSGKKKVAVRVHIERSRIGIVRNIDRRHPSGSTIRRASELSAVASEETGPKLILKAMAHTAGLIDGKPFLVAAMPGAALKPRLPAIGRVPDIVAEKGLSLVRLQTEIEKFTGLIAVRHRVAAEDVIFQHTGERPRRSAVRRISPASLPKVGVNAVELPPGDHHLVAIRRVN